MCHWPQEFCIDYYLIVSDIPRWGDKLGIYSVKYARFNMDRLVCHWVTALTYKLGIRSTLRFLPVRRFWDTDENSKGQEFPVGIWEAPFLPLRHCDTLMWEMLLLIPLNFLKYSGSVFKIRRRKKPSPCRQLFN